MALTWVVASNITCSPQPWHGFTSNLRLNYPSTTEGTPLQQWLLEEWREERVKRQQFAGVVQGSRAGDAHRYSTPPYATFSSPACEPLVSVYARPLQEAREERSKRQQFGGNWHEIQQVCTWHSWIQLRDRRFRRNSPSQAARENSDRANYCVCVLIKDMARRLPLGLQV